MTCPVLTVGADHGYGNGSFATMEKVAANPEAWIARECGRYVAEEHPRELADALMPFIAKSRR